MRRYLFPIIAALAVASCHEDLQEPGTRGSSGPSLAVDSVVTCPARTGNSEGELFGDIYSNGELICVAGAGAYLEPDAETNARMQGYFDEPFDGTQPFTWVNNNKRHFAWWDPFAHDGKCQVMPRTPDSYHAEVHPFTSNTILETHCLLTGRYTFSLSGLGEAFSIPVDYLRGQFIEDAPGDAKSLYVELPVASTGGTVSDLVIDFELATGCSFKCPSESHHLEIENAGGSRYKAGFSPSSTPTGDASDWFRFRASASHVSYGLFGNKYLARLYWNYPAEPQSLTGYYDPIQQTDLIRVHRFPNPTSAVDTVYVGLEIMRPDERPAVAPTSTWPIILNRIFPDLKPGTITPPASATPGSNASVTIGEKNVATDSFAVAEAGWQGRLYLSTNQSLDLGTDPLVGTFTESQAISQTTTITRSRSISIPGSQSPGAYYIIASFDAQNSVLEIPSGGEANNIAASSSTIQVTPPPCQITPSYVQMESGESKLLWLTQSCLDRYIEITPSSPVAGFNSTCSVRTKSGLYPFKVTVYGCNTGGATLRVYTDASKTTILESVSIDVDIF